MTQIIFQIVHMPGKDRKTTLSSWENNPGCRHKGRVKIIPQKHPAIWETYCSNNCLVLFIIHRTSLRTYWPHLLKSATTFAQSTVLAWDCTWGPTTYLLLEALFSFVKATLWCFTPSFKSLYASLESDTWIHCRSLTNKEDMH